MASSDRTTQPSSGWPELLLLVAGLLGVIAIGITLLAVSLPNGLKFVVVVGLVQLTAICMALALLTGRRSLRD